MIGGNIPGKTKVLSIAIYHFVERGAGRRRTGCRRAWCCSPSSCCWPCCSWSGERTGGRCDRRRRGRIRGRVRRLPAGGWIQAPHAVTGLNGPSGCGKTTLIRCIAGLPKPARPPRGGRRGLAGRARVPSAPPAAGGRGVPGSEPAAPPLGAGQPDLWRAAGQRPLPRGAGRRGHAGPLALVFRGRRAPLRRRAPARGPGPGPAVAAAPAADGRAPSSLDAAARPRSSPTWSACTARWHADALRQP